MKSRSRDGLAAKGLLIIVFDYSPNGVFRGQWKQMMKQVG